MCQPIIQSLSFSSASYGSGAVITATVVFTGCSGPFTAAGADTGGLTWTVSATDNLTFANLQALAGANGTFTLTVTVTSEDDLADSQTWPFTVSGTSSNLGLVGATVNAGSYGLSTSQSVQAAQQFDGYLPSGVIPAMTKQRWFWDTEGSYNPTDPGLVALLNNGCKVVVNVKPTRTTNAGTIASQQSALTTAITTLQATSTNFEIALWKEMNEGAFPSGGIDYPAYWANYAPTIQATGQKCVYDPGANANVYALGCTYFQALSPVPDVFSADYYIGGFKEGTLLDQPSGNATHGVSTTSFTALADGAGIPFGLAEWGYNLKDGAPTTDDIALWGSPVAYIDSAGKQHSQSYVGYLISLFQARIAAGKANGDICGFFSTNAPNATVYSGIFATGDFKSGIYTQTIDAVSGGNSTQTILGLKQVWDAAI